MSSGRILQRYNHHSFLFYSVWRGVGLIYSQRDAVGVQDVRCWGPHGERQALVLPNTEKIDVVWRSVVTPEVPPQEGKVRMRVDLGAYRIVWRPQMNGCEVTFVSEAALGASIPTCKSMDVTNGSELHVLTYLTATLHPRPLESFEYGAT